MAVMSRSESTVGEVYSPRAVSLRTAVPDYARRDSARGKGLWARRAYGLNQNGFLPCTFKSLLKASKYGFRHLLIVRVRLWCWSHVSVAWADEVASAYLLQHDVGLFRPLGQQSMILEGPNHSLDAQYVLNRLRLRFRADKSGDIESRGLGVAKNGLETAASNVSCEVSWLYSALKNS